MGVYVFDNQVFDSWLTKKSDEILYKVDREKISTEEMLILILKAQTNHFHHVDIEFREEFKNIRHFHQQTIAEFQKIRTEFFYHREEQKQDSEKLRSDLRSELKIEISYLRLEIKKDLIDFKQEFKADIDKLWNFQKWYMGMTIVLFGGLYLKLFLG